MISMIQKPLCLLLMLFGFTAQALSEQLSAMKGDGSFQRLLQIEKAQ